MVIREVLDGTVGRWDECDEQRQRGIKAMLSCECSESFIETEIDFVFFVF